MKGYKNLYTGETIKYVPRVNKTGSPTINSNCIASNFSSSNYLTLPTAFTPSSNTWEFVFKIDSLNTSSGNQYFLFCDSRSRSWLPRLGLDNGGFFLVLTNSTNSYNVCSISTSLPTQYPVWLRCRFTGSQYDISYSYDGINYTVKDSQSTSTTYNASLSMIGWGNDTGSGGDTRNGFNGFIDLKESYIKVGNNYFWKGAEPVTLQNIKLIKHKQSNTNVITHIANDIKLEANNNIPILKAGSVVYIPNGFEEDGTTKKFDRVVLEADCTSSSAWSTTHYLFFRTSNPTVFQRSAINKTHSGDTTPTPVGSDDMWYDTANNVIKRYDGTNWNAQGTCLPVGIYNGTTQQFEAIFNGFGFIDRIEFVLPDVSVLIPNGLNADGTFKTVEYTNTSVRTSTGYPNTQGQVYFLMADGGRHTVRTDRYMWGSDSAKPTTVATTNAFMYYAIDTNIMYTTYGSTTADWFVDLSVPLYTTYGDGTTITSITPRAVEPSTIPIYKAVDLN